jgi:hypothetical protein
MGMKHTPEAKKRKWERLKNKLQNGDLRTTYEMQKDKILNGELKEEEDFPRI